MSAARKRYALVLTKSLIREDLPCIEETECEPFFRQALQEIAGRTDEREKKTGRLTGAFSTSFFCDRYESEPSGRVVYTLRGTDIYVFAAHPDHDEAYRRARKRAARYL